MSTPRFLAALIAACLAQADKGLVHADDEPREAAELLAKEGRVGYIRAGAHELAATRGQKLAYHDIVHTLEFSQATLGFTDRSRLTLGEMTSLEILPPPPQGRSPWMELIAGAVYLFSHEKPRAIQIKTRHGNGAGLGTEFLVQVEENRTIFTVFDGTVELSNEAGHKEFHSGEQGIMEFGKIPYLAPRLAAANVIQWWLYYPGVLNPEELAFDALESRDLDGSLSAYRAGDLRAAVEKLPGFPAVAEPRSENTLAYYAGLLLAVGQPARAEQYLNKLPPESRLGSALRVLIAAVRTPEKPLQLAPTSASEWLAYSYYQQARHDLRQALAAAERAVFLSTNFAFGWARVAELQFGHGDIRAAQRALDRSLALGPKNAQAVALQGFLYAADNRINNAVKSFEEAANLDSGLANAWFGRGLCSIRKGDLLSGLTDLQTAVGLEPDRALLRSYLGKAFHDAGAETLAHREFDRSQALDPKDPTSWLYQALADFQENRLNEAVRELETSVRLNDNRQLFRSRSLLDQDRAVRSVNLAAIYRDAGLGDVSLQEASKAVVNDYANFSAHLFLANSYNALRDPNLVNLRYETVVSSEYRLANILSPVGGTALSPRVSQQEYSRLFDRNHFGFTSETGYRSDGAWSQSVVQHGVFDNTGYAIEADYRTLPNPGKGADLEQTAASIQFKQQLSAADSVSFEADFDRVRAGDLRTVYDPATLNPTLHSKEVQVPNLFLGYHHEWSPGVRTLFLFARLTDQFELQDSTQRVALILRPTGQLESGKFRLDYESDFAVYSAELQQIWETDRNAIIAGSRFQFGQTETDSEQIHAVNFPPPPFYSTPAASQFNRADLQRISAYGYYQQNIGDQFTAIGGLTFDALHYPENVSSPPISDEERDVTQLSPKLGFLWSPHRAVLARAAYSRSLGGVFFENSVRLEPPQLLGFPQAYRSLAPESVVGAIPGTEFNIFDLAMDFRLSTKAYAGWQLELLRSDAHSVLGAFSKDTTDPQQSASPSTVSQNVDYEEKSLSCYLNQLVSDEWSLGSRYRLTDSRLDRELQHFAAEQTEEALLHELTAFVLFNHPSGFYTTLEGVFLAQQTKHSVEHLDQERVWHLDLLAGYRFPRRHAELQLGVLNLTDKDYRLNPINIYPDLPRSRSFVASLRLNF